MHAIPYKVMKALLLPCSFEIYQISSQDKSENTFIKYVYPT